MDNKDMTDFIILHKAKVLQIKEDMLENLLKADLLWISLYRSRKYHQ